ncbi:PKD domain-containing protein [Methanosarcina sp. T3]|uniref:PKD domain-containing protein n=1 Tax=Methanosarcina sp. T3 TaxID=3439062 RepID=UPI003F83C5CD
MKNLKNYVTVFAFALLYLTLSSPAALASNIVIDDDAQPAVSGLYLTSDYKNDAACIQAALDNSKSGDTITIREGDYYITQQISQKDKSLNIVGEGEVTLHLQTAESQSSTIFFTGSMITNEPLSADAQKGSSQITLTDASQVRQNDLIKIWKNVQWCPLDYPDQMTGEIYAVQSVNGNVITLNQPLLRDYKLSETVQVEVYRPIEIHIKNIRIQDSGATTSHHGLALRYCKDSSVTDSWFKDSGLAALSFYSCFNVDAKNNEIYNSILPGSGYGVAVWSGSAFVNIENNHIENCRHAITGNTNERKALNRDVYIASNTLIGANINGANVIDAHPVTINYIVTKNKIYPQLPYFFAFLDGAQYSEFTENEVYGGYGAVARRGSVNDGTHIIKDNLMNGISGCTYQGGENGIGNTLTITNNVQKGGEYGIIFPNYESFKNIEISGNQFSDISYQGVYQKFHINGVNLQISDNTFENIKRDGIYIDGNSFTNGVVKVQNNILVNVYPTNPGSEITIKDIQNVLVSGNQVINGNQAFKVPVAAFSASPVSGNAPLNVVFTDTSTNSPTAWKWNFGDGTTSTAKNPTHTYSSAGSYTVTLTASNTAGSNTVTKSSYIKVTAASSQKPVANFSSSVTSGSVPLNIVFTDTSANSPTAWEWNFGDGTTSTAKNPTHTYSSAGNYSITLKATNSAGSSTVTKWLIRTGARTMQFDVEEVNAVQKPVANFSSSVTSGSVPLNIVFTDTSANSPTAWEWNFGDGTTSTAKNPTHTYSSAGNYSITLKATNSAGNSMVTKWLIRTGARTMQFE